MSHASDRVRGNGPSVFHGGEAFAIRPPIVGKHSKKIFACIKELLSTKRAAIQNYPSRCDWLRKDDTMTEVTMTNSAVTSTATR